MKKIIIAHRGASAYENENTVASYKKALGGLLITLQKQIFEFLHQLALMMSLEYSSTC